MVGGRAVVGAWSVRARYGGSPPSASLLDSSPSPLSPAQVFLSRQHLDPIQCRVERGVWARSADRGCVGGAVRLERRKAAQDGGFLVSTKGLQDLKAWLAPRQCLVLRAAGRSKQPLQPLVMAPFVLTHKWVPTNSSELSNEKFCLHYRHTTSLTSPIAPESQSSPAISGSHATCCTLAIL